MAGLTPCWSGDSAVSGWGLQLKRRTLGLTESLELSGSIDVSHHQPQA